MRCAISGRQGPSSVWHPRFIALSTAHRTLHTAHRSTFTAFPRIPRIPRLAFVNRYPLFGLPPGSQLPTSNSQLPGIGGRFKGGCIRQ